MKDFKGRTLKIFASYYGPHKKLFILDMACAFMVTLTDLAFPYVSRISMQTLLPQGLFRTFFTVIAVLVAAYILRSVFYYIISYWGHILGVRIEADMREDIFTHIQTLSFSFFDKNRTGILMSRATTDLFDITELAHHGPEDFFISAVTILGALVILATVQWRLALVLFIVLPIFILFVVFQRKRMRAANMAVKARTADINATIESSISGIRTAKAFANEEVEEEKFHLGNERFKGAKNLFYKAFAVFHSGMEFTMSIMQVIVIAVGGLFIMRGEMDYVDLLTFTLYVSTFTTPIRKLAQFVEMYTQGMAGFTRFLEIMRTEPDIQDPPDAMNLAAVRGEIEYKNVDFSYNEGSEILKGINLHIKAGECLAVVGPSGGGKTTLCQLLPRFYDVTGGSISVDGHDVRDVTQHSLRKSIGILQQDVFMFAGTVRDNIRYGRPDATDEEIIEAAKQAEIHSEIMELPEDYDTYIGERGVMLSGGQKQRISIARVFLKNPPVLILDEATSALDSVTEARIQKALDGLSEGRTCIIIAHRLSTIRGADQIAVVEGERIMEKGSHDELMEKGGLYAELYKAQSFAADGSL